MSAVAIAAIAVAVASYEGTRSELQGQVDQSLQDRLIKKPLGNIGIGPEGGHSPLPQTPCSCRAGRRRGDPDEGLGWIDRLPPQAFGGASGMFTVFKPDGGTCVPPGETYQIPVDAGHPRARGHLDAASSTPT